MDLVPHPQVGRIYAGGLLQCADDSILLQRRDDKPGIRNRGLITAFGGAARESESPPEALLRELREELELVVAVDQLVPIAVIDKREEDGSPTRCYFYLIEGVNRQSLSLHEGSGFEAGDVDSLIDNPSVTDTCRSALRQLQLRRRHVAHDDGSTTELCLVADAAHPVNEDAARFTRTSFCLVDGASPQGTKPHIDQVSDARWVAETAAAFLTSPTDVAASPLPHMLRSAIGHVGVELVKRGYPDDEPPPSAAAALCRVRNQILEYAAIADVSIAAQSSQGTWVLEDRISMLREAYLIHLESEQGPDAVKASVIDRRTNYMNRPGGYWVFSDNPTAADYARFGFVELAPGGRILLASDGFARVVSPFGLCGWEDLLSASETELRQYVSRLRALEDSDPSRVNYKRVTPADDATALLVAAAA